MFSFCLSIFWPTVPIWSCRQFPFPLSFLSLFFSFRLPFFPQQLPSFIMLFSISSPFCSSGRIAYFCFIFFTPAQFIPQFSLPPQAISHSITFTSCSTKCSLEDLLSFSFPSSNQFSFYFPSSPHFVNSCRCSFSYSLFFIVSSFPFLSNLLYHLSQILLSLCPFPILSIPSFCPPVFTVMRALWRARLVSYMNCHLLSRHHVGQT